MRLSSYLESDAKVLCVCRYIYKTTLFWKISRDSGNKNCFLDSIFGSYRLLVNIASQLRIIIICL